MAAERKGLVLGLMRDQKFITEDQYIAALGEKIHLSPVKKSNEAAYFLAMLREELGERYELPALVSQGWKIFTTLDPLLQHAAVEVVGSPLPSPTGRGRRSPGEAAPQAALVGAACDGSDSGAALG